MSCSSPLLAADLGIKENGKRYIKLLPKRWDYDFQHYKDIWQDKLLLLPCGSCPACILSRRKMWSLRCYAESLYHRENCFLTLTYDDAHIKSPNKEDFQSFIAALRNKGLKIRYFGCGELGGTTSRFHLHIVLFGFFPKDAKYHSMSSSGFPIYTSKFLEKIWVKGFITVQEFSPETAGYTAGYVDKKYKTEECFVLMSKRPGLGEQFFYDRYKDFYKTDSLVTNFGSHVASIPRYFDKLAEKIGYDLSALKDERINKMSLEVYKDMREHDETIFEQSLRRKQLETAERLNKKKRGL